MVWPNQKDRFEEFQHFRVAVLHGPHKEALLQSDDYDIYVVNPEGLEWLFGAEWRRNSKGDRELVIDSARVRFVCEKFGLLCVDESTKFRNSQTNRFKLLKKVVGKFKRRYILTGSPRPKSLEDLFGQVYILDEGRSLGRYITHFRNEYMMAEGYGGYSYAPQPGAEARVAERIKDLVQVVEQKGNVDVPELLFNDIYIDLDQKARKIYDQMEDDLLALIASGGVVAANAAVASGKCRQIANGAVYDEFKKWHLIHDEKLDALEDLLDQLSGAPALITYQFEFDKERIEKRLKIPCISTGNMKHDSAYIAKFARGELPAVMGQPQSVSLGTDGLQDNCHDIIMFGMPWSFLDYEQVIDRVRRQGNRSSYVTVHRIIARNTVDERVLGVLEGRNKTQAAFMTMLQELRRNR